MANPLERIQQFVEEKPWLAVGAVVGGAAVVAFALSRREEPEPVDENGVPITSSPLANMEASPLPVLINQTALQPPSPQQVPEQSFVSILREGRVQNVTAGPAGACPPGYVSAQQPGQPPRCTLVNPERKLPGQRQVFFPSRGEGAFI